MRAAFSHSWSRAEGQKASFLTFGAGPEADKRLGALGFEADFRLSHDNRADTRCMTPSSRGGGHGEEGAAVGLAGRRRVVRKVFGAGGEQLRENKARSSSRPSADGLSDQARLDSETQELKTSGMRAGERNGRNKATGLVAPMTGRLSR